MWSGNHNQQHLLLSSLEITACLEEPSIEPCPAVLPFCCIEVNKVCPDKAFGLCSARSIFMPLMHGVWTFSGKDPSIDASLSPLQARRGHV